MNRRNELPEPLNTTERMLYEIAVRQGILIEQVSSIVEYLSTQNNVATTSNKVEEKIAVQKVVEDVEIVPMTRKRAPRKKAVEKEVE